MFAGDDLAELGTNSARNYATPRAVFEALVLPRGPWNGGNVFFQVLYSPEYGIDGASRRSRLDTKLNAFRRGIQNLRHMRNAAVRLGDCPNT